MTEGPHDVYGWGGPELEAYSARVRQQGTVWCVRHRRRHDMHLWTGGWITYECDACQMEHRLAYQMLEEQ